MRWSEVINWPSFSVRYTTDADDFNPEAGFVKPSEEGGDVWEGEDEGLVIEDDKQDPKLKREFAKSPSQASKFSLSLSSCGGGEEEQSGEDRGEEGKEAR